MTGPDPPSSLLRAMSFDQDEEPPPAFLGQPILVVPVVPVVPGAPVNRASADRRPRTSPAAASLTRAHDVVVAPTEVLDGRLSVGEVRGVEEGHVQCRRSRGRGERLAALQREQ
jgi:hypothetical protein